MNTPLAISGFLHATMLLAMVLTVQCVTPLRLDQPSAVTVRLAKASDLPSIARGTEEATAPIVQGNDGTAQTTPIKPPQPMPQPPTAQPTAPTIKTPRLPVKVTQNPDPVAPVVKQKQFDPDQLDRIIKASPTPTPPTALETRQQPKADLRTGAPTSQQPTQPVLGTPSGTSQLSEGEANELIAIMREQLVRCWRINAGHPDAAKMILKFEFDLNRDGSLRGEPRLIGGSVSPDLQAAVTAARQAFACAAPFKGMPPDKYEHWQHAGFTFDPSRLFR